MPVEIKEIFFKADSTPLPDNKLARVQGIAWDHNHELRYILPAIERALGLAELEKVHSLIQEARHYHPHSQELDFIELRVQLFLTVSDEKTMSYAEQYIKKYPNDVAGWMIYIQLVLITKSPVDLNKVIEEAFSEDETTCEALKLFSKETYDSNFENEVLALLEKEPEHLLSQYLLLTVPNPAACITEEWEAQFEWFLNTSNYSLPFETVYDVLISAMELGQYESVLEWINRQEEHKQTLSLLFLKMICHLMRKEELPFKETLSFIRTKGESCEIRNPLFVGADRARSSITYSLGHMSKAPPRLLFEVGEVLAYICESELSLKVLKQIEKDYKHDPRIMARMGYLESFEESENPYLAVSRYFEIAFRECQNNPRTLAYVNTLCGKAMMILNTYNEATVYLEKGFQDQVYMDLIEAYLNTNKVSAAERLIVESQQRGYPITSSNWITIGISYHKAGEHQKALDALDKVETSQSNAFIISSKKAELYSTLNRFEEAVAEARKALSTDPANSILWAVLGYSAHRINDQTTSFEAYCRQAKLTPVNGTRLFAIITMGKALNREDETVEILEGVDPAELDQETLLLGLETISKVKNHDLCEEWLQYGMNAYPDCLDLRVLRANLRFEISDFIGAMQDYEAAGKGFEDSIAKCRNFLTVPMPIEYARS